MVGAFQRRRKLEQVVVLTRPGALALRADCSGHSLLGQRRDRAQDRSGVEAEAAHCRLRFSAYSRAASAQPGLSQWASASFFGRGNTISRKGSTKPSNASATDISPASTIMCRTAARPRKPRRGSTSTVILIGTDDESPDRSCGGEMVIR